MFTSKLFFVACVSCALIVVASAQDASEQSDAITQCFRRYTGAFAEYAKSVTNETTRLISSFTGSEGLNPQQVNKLTDRLTESTQKLFDYNNFTPVRLVDVVSEIVGAQMDIARTYTKVTSDGSESATNVFTRLSDRLREIVSGVFSTCTRVIPGWGRK